MASLTGALLNSAKSLATLTQTFDVIENNVTNANTPGYARQDPSLQADAFNPLTGLAGGVSSGPLLNSRSEYLEQAVRDQQTSLGDAQQRANDLNQIQPLFSLTSTTGVASALTSFFNTFSELSVNPNDEVSRQSVITQAGNLAQQINQSVAGIQQVSSNVTSQTGVVVTQINQLAGQIARINQQYRQDVSATHDESLDANLHNALESLAGLAGISVIKTNDGAINVYLGGQIPLVLGDQSSPISATNISSQTAILDADGNDVTARITTGQLGALIQEKNATLTGYVADLGTLAQSLADSVNGALASGVDKSGNPPAANLFSYNPANPASSLAVTNITPDQIAAASAAAPGGNGNAIALAQLADAPAVNGFTFTQFYGNLSSRVGTDAASAQQDQAQAQDQLTQAEAQRTRVSGVDLNAEATRLLQYQQAYQAVGKMVSVLDSLTSVALNMIQPSAVG